MVFLQLANEARNKVPVKPCGPWDLEKSFQGWDACVGLKRRIGTSPNKELSLPKTRGYTEFLRIAGGGRGGGPIVKPGYRGPTPPPSPCCMWRPLGLLHDRSSQTYGLKQYKLRTLREGVRLQLDSSLWSQSWNEGASWWWASELLRLVVGCFLVAPS